MAKNGVTLIKPTIALCAAEAIAPASCLKLESGFGRLRPAGSGGRPGLTQHESSVATRH